MSSTAATLERLTLDERIRRNVIVRTLYNAGDEPIRFVHAGVPYVIPPDGPCRERIVERPNISKPGIVADRGEHLVYDGTLQIFDRYGVEPKLAQAYRRLVRAGRPANKPVADKLLAGALDIVKHALTKTAKAGVTFLEGDPGVDQPEIEAARERAIAFKVESVERTLRAYQARTASFHTDPRNKGQIAPPMDKREREAQKWLDEYRLGLKSTPTFRCPNNCGFEDDDIEAIKRHVRASYPLNAAELLAKLEAESGSDPDPDPEPKSAGRRGKKA